MKRVEALRILTTERTNELVITSVGQVTNELYNVGDRETNLYRVQMSYASPMALGLALSVPDRTVIVLDGDGSILLNLGVLATIANYGPKNLKVIVFDNGYYHGPGMPTATAGKTNLEAIAKGAGIGQCRTVHDVVQFREALRFALSAPEVCFIVAKVERNIDVAEKIIPYDLMENTFIFRQALIKEGLIEGWHELYPGHHKEP